MKKSNRCIIIPAYLRGHVLEAYTPLPDDFVLCADGGYAHAIAAGLSPDLVIGDCDSGVDIPPALLARVPVEKDDTDTMLCMRYAIAHGYQHCLIIGGIGGRLDHTFANIQTLAFALRHGIHAQMRDAYERVWLLEHAEAILQPRNGHTFSIFSYTERCTGVHEHGVKYPLKDATLTQHFPLGVSNRITGPQACISVQEGILLIMQSKLQSE